MSKSYAEENEYDSVVQNYHRTSTGKEIPITDEYCTPLSEPIVPTQNEVSYADGYCTPLSEPIIPTNGLRQLKSLNAGTHYQFKNELGKDNSEIYESATTIEHEFSSPDKSSNHYFHPPGKMDSKESTGNIYECAIIDNYNDRQNDEYAVVDKSRKTSNKPKVNESSKRPPKSPSSNSSKTEDSGDSYITFKNLMNKNDIGVIERRKQRKVVKLIAYGVMVLLLISVCYLSYVCHELNEKIARNDQQIYHRTSKLESALQSLNKQRMNDTYLTQRNINKTANFVKEALQKESKKRISDTNLFGTKINETIDSVKKVDSRLKEVISSGVLMRLAFLKIEDKHSRSGLIQLWLNRQWRYIFAITDTFHNNEAEVVCKTMGYTTGTYDDGYYNKRPSEVSDFYHRITVKINCNDDERTILQCSIDNNRYDFGTRKFIGVLCH